jgi:hypothetical protein
MKDVHLVVGIAAIAVNLLAALIGAWHWWRGERSVTFWRVLRLGQALVVVQAALGGVLLATGHKPHHLHVLYGLLPLLVSFIAEALRSASAQMVLDARGYASAQDVGRLPPDEQRGIVLAIMHRELGVMTAAALVVVALLLRAAQTAG